MPCPFFDPEAPFPWEAWPNPPRMPLGDPYLGHCTAQKPSGGPVTDPTQLPLCNTGYARGVCPRFPLSDAPDAVRFGIVTLAPVITVRYVTERDHHPHGHGLLHLGHPFDRASASLLERQARAFLGSYQRRNEQGRNEQRRNEIP